MRICRLFAGFLLAGLLASVGSAELISNWSAPATWTPPAAHGVRTLSETPPRAFIGVTPCRILDTRGTGGVPINTGGKFGANVTRTYTITGLCGLPATVDAVSVNFTVLNTDSSPFGYLSAGPGGSPVPANTSILNWQTAGVQESNAAVVALNSGQIAVETFNAGANVLMDVNGYYSSVLGTPSNFFELTTSSAFYTMYLKNLSTSCSGACGLRQETNSNTDNKAIVGLALGATGVNVGVLGETTSNSDLTRGVWGYADTGTAQAYGVLGYTTSTNHFAAGVAGISNQANAEGGVFYNNGPPISTVLSFQDAGVNYGLWTDGRISGASLSIAGAPKNFVSPHPLDPSKEIAYASVEAPTVDVYFRGTGTLANGYGRIDVPEHFRFTAREGTYMTTLTPVGRPVSLSVESEGPEGIVVRGSGSGSFHYVVYAERAEIEGYEPVRPNTSFVPSLMERVHLLKALPRTTKDLLVKNGTLNEDGTYNEMTARAMGWVIPEPKSLAEAQK